MKRGSTIFLRGAILIIGTAALAICIFALPGGIMSDAGPYLPVFLGLYIPAMPFFFALYQTLKLLHYIDKNKAFSKSAIKALKYIKYCAVIISLLFTAGLPFLYIAVQADDSPGVFGLGLGIVFASAVIATAAGVLQRLVQNVIDIKSENDLTV